MSSPSQSPPPPSRKLIISRGLFFVVAICIFGLAAVTICSALLRGFRYSQIVQDGGSSALSPTERLYLQAYLSPRIDDLYLPAGNHSETASFEIALGEGAGEIADNLVAAGLLNDRDLFLNYARYYGYDSQLEAGTYSIEPDITLADLTVTLTQAVAQEAFVTFLEGWRIEEMADHLNDQPVADINGDEFLAIAQRRQLYDLTRYDFLASLPAGATLEGYLFPDTYRVALDATTEDLVDLMLQNFGERITPAMRQSYGVRGLSLREAIVIASIVQREAVHDFEKPIIAQVFLTRYEINMMLQADPTVQYAVGYWPEGDSWWKSPLWLDDLALDSPYNTYVYGGLPPGPIANPGLAALQAVAEPADSDFIFFVVDCRADQPNTHAFSHTYAEHEAVVNACR